MFPYADDSPAPVRNFAIVAISLVNIVIFLGMLGGAPIDLNVFGFVPLNHAWYAWVTSQFLHGGFDHIIGNLWALWIFGDRVAHRLGRWFLPFYLAGGCAANMLMMLLDPHSLIPCIGASGAISAVIGAYVFWFPKARMRCLWFGRIPGQWSSSVTFFTISALVFAVSFFLEQMIGVLGGSDSGVAYSAHIGGLAFGIGVALLFSSDPEETVRMIPCGEWEPIAQALSDDQTEYAARLYAETLGKDPMLALPDPDGLKLVDALVRLEQPLLALAGARRQRERFPSGEAAPYLYELEGFVLADSFHDRAAAIGAYSKALSFAKIVEASRLDIQARLSVLRNDSASPSAGSSGFKLPAARMARTLDSNLSKLTVDGRDIPWHDCALICVIGLPLGPLARKSPGILDVEVESWSVESGVKIGAEYEDFSEPIPCLEIILANQTDRWHWADESTADNEAAAIAFYNGVQAILLNAPALVCAPAASESFLRRIPDGWNFKTLEDAELHLEEQCRAARIRQKK